MKTDPTPNAETREGVDGHTLTLFGVLRSAIATGDLRIFKGDVNRKTVLMVENLALDHLLVNAHFDGLEDGQ
jgi:hypothetical protein